MFTFLDGSVPAKGGSQSAAGITASGANRKHDVSVTDMELGSRAAAQRDLARRRAATRSGRSTTASAVPGEQNKRTGEM